MRTYSLLGLSLMMFSAAAQNMNIPVTAGSSV